MKSTDSLRRQHSDLLRLADEIAPLLDAGRLTRDSTLARLKLSTWVRKLRVHLALEDRSIYPRLRHADPNMAAKAAQHRREMQAMHERVMRRTPPQLSRQFETEADATTFIREVKAQFDLLSKSFELEENEFYVLVDAIPSGTWTIDGVPVDPDVEKRKLVGKGS